MALATHTRLGPYEVVAPLGAGGMGEVYRARDSRLGREIAIKVLPDAAASDPERLRRFEQEARAAGALNHPNILDIHDVGTHEGAPYVVSELLEGKTLRDRLRAGALPVRDAVGYAVQIARGLAAAHEKHIIHRDIKPENLFVTRQGRVKILDFGLAKLTRSDERVGSGADTQTKAPLTDAGRVMGTVGYMSPEQLSSGNADHRSDIFSFGAVLYEMLSGQRAFRGETDVQTLNAILTEDPPSLFALGCRVPATLDRLVRRCLEKLPEERFRSAEDVASELEAISDEPEATLTGERTRRRPGLAAWVAALLVLSGSGAVWLLVARRGSAPEPAPAGLVPLANHPGAELLPSLSPDGSRVAFSWDGEQTGNFDLYVKQIGTETVLRLTRDPGFDGASAWSPDGGHLAFGRCTGAELAYFIVSALGGPERRVHTVHLVPPDRGLPGSGLARPLSWSPDGRHLALTDGPAGKPRGIALLSVETLERTRLTEPTGEFSGDYFPTFSPDGQSLAFLRISGSSFANGDIYQVPVAGGEPRRLTFDNSMIAGVDWTRDGRELVFSSWRAGLPGLWRIASSGGTPARVTPGGETAGFVSIARAANRLAYDSPFSDADIWRIEMIGPVRGRTPVPVVSSTAWEASPAISPDGNRIAFASARSGSWEIWVCRAPDGSSCVQLTSFRGSHCGSPQWSPDGREVAFDCRPEGNADVFAVDVESRVVRQITRELSEEVLPSWSGDGRRLYFGSNRSGSWQVWETPAGGGRAIQVTTGGGFAAVESPKAESIYFSRTPWGTDIWTRSLESGEEDPVLDYAGGGWGCWDVARDGLYYVDVTAQPRPAIERFAPATGRVTRVAELEVRPVCDLPNLAVSPDGRWLLYGHAAPARSDLILIENFR